MKHVKQVIVTVAMVIALALMGEAQISVPHTFTTTVPVSQLNTNFSTVADGALKRNGGNVTGNITADSGITYDGIDVGAVLGGSGTGAFATLTTSNTGSSSLDVAGGAKFGTGDIQLIGTGGKIPGISSLYFDSLSGANLTGIVSSGLTASTNTVSFSAGNFTADGPMTWTVASTNHNAYKDVGTMMVWSFAVPTSTTGGTATMRLKITLPAGRTVATNTNGLCSGSFTTTALNPLWTAEAGNTYISIFRDDLATTWPLVATLSVRCNPIIFF